MNDSRRWRVLVVAALIIGGMVAFARGPRHRRGGQRVEALSDDLSAVAVAGE